MQIDFDNASREELKAACILAFSSNNILESTVSSQQQELESRNRKIEQLKFELYWLKRQLFGHKSEKQIPQDPKQGTLFDIPETPPSDNSVTVKSFERTHRRKPTDTSVENTIRFDESVPVDEEVILPDEVKGLLEDQYEVISEKVTDRLVQIPTQYRVKRTIRKTVKLIEEKTLHTAPAPVAIIERSFADVSFLTGMLVDKFQYHLPLYRQHQRLRYSGINISRSHLTRLLHRTLELLEPIYNAILSDITTSEVVCMDEIPIKAGRKIAGKMNTAYFWTVLAENQVAFVYSSSRSYDNVSKILGAVCEKLVSDGFPAYDRYAEDRGDLVHGECWAHARRKFFEAKDFAPPECEKILSLIAYLFEVERDLKDKPPDEILSVRREKSTVIIENIFEYLDELWLNQMVDRRGPLGQAIFYTRERKKSLSEFLDHPDMPISNNHVERAIRPVAIGRKNWLFCWSEVGAKYAAIAFTLIESCKMNKINPWEYIMDVLQRLDTHPAREVHLLTPKYWKKS